MASNNDVETNVLVTFKASYSNKSAAVILKTDAPQACCLEVRGLQVHVGYVILTNKKLPRRRH